MVNEFVRPTSTNVDGFLKNNFSEMEDRYWVTINNYVEESKLSVELILKNYPAFIRRRDLPRLLAQYELFKLIRDIPGSVVELGVYLGAGLFTFAKLMETFCPGDRSRKIYGFDTFDGYKDFKENDGEVGTWIDKGIGTKKSSYEIMQSITDINNLDNFLAGVERTVIIPGDISQTVPKFASEPTGVRISLLYFDSNLYEPTMTGLKYLYPLVVPGGVVAFNAYGIPPWEGESKAFEEYFADKKMPTLRKFDFSHIPSAFFIKE